MGLLRFDNPVYYERNLRLTRLVVYDERSATLGCGTVSADFVPACAYQTWGGAVVIQEVIE